MRASGRSSTCVVDGGNVTPLDHNNIPVSMCLIRARLFSTNNLLRSALDFYHESNWALAAGGCPNLRAHSVSTPFQDAGSVLFLSKIDMI